MNSYTYSSNDNTFHAFLDSVSSPGVQHRLPVKGTWFTIPSDAITAGKDGLFYYAKHNKNEYQVQDAKGNSTTESRPVHNVVAFRFQLGKTPAATSHMTEWFTRAEVISACERLRHLSYTRMGIWLHVRDVLVPSGGGDISPEIASLMREYVKQVLDPFLALSAWVAKLEALENDAAEVFPVFSSGRFVTIDSKTEKFVEGFFKTSNSKTSRRSSWFKNLRKTSRTQSFNVYRVLDDALAGTIDDVTALPNFTEATKVLLNNFTESYVAAFPKPVAPSNNACDMEAKTEDILQGLVYLNGIDSQVYEEWQKFIQTVQSKAGLMAEVGSAVDRSIDYTHCEDSVFWMDGFTRRWMEDIKAPLTPSEMAEGSMVAWSRKMWLTVHGTDKASEKSTNSSSSSLLVPVADQ